MLKFGVKSAILGATVYYTLDAGVWGDSDRSKVLYDDIQKKMEPYIDEIKNQIPYKLPELPQTDHVSYLTKYYWNSGVKTTFRFLVDLPAHTANAACKSYQYISDTLNQESLQTPTEPSKK